MIETSVMEELMMSVLRDKRYIFEINYLNLDKFSSSSSLTEITLLF